MDEEEESRARHARMRAFQAVQRKHEKERRERMEESWGQSDGPTEQKYDSSEQDELMEIFSELLRSVTRDGGRKRARGEKPSWKVDQSHRAAIFSHLNKYEHGEREDPDSGVHPFVHLAWRALAVAWQEMHAEDNIKEKVGDAVNHANYVTADFVGGRAAEEVIHWENYSEGAHYASPGCCPEPDCG